MRNILTVAACVALVGLSGCMGYGDKTHCGFHFEIIKPPTIDTNTPVLIQASGPVVGAHPLGTLAGPVTEGSMKHGPSVNTLMSPQFMPTLPRSGANAADCCTPPGPRGISVEEWCRIMNEMKGKPMPAAQE